MIERSANRGTVTAKTYSGGIVGRMAYSTNEISCVNHCFNSGKVTTAAGGYYADGIVGQNGRASTASADDSSRGGRVRNSWNSGEVTVPGSCSAYSGGIYCSLYGAGTVENCYFLDSSAASAGFSTTGTVTEPDEMTAAQSADVFASGKIAWYLNHKGGNAETVWFQNVDNDRDHNEYPVLDSKSAAVHACGFTEQRDIFADQREDELPETVAGTVTKSVEVKNGAPVTTMNTPKADLMDSVLTNSEKADVTSGTNAHIWLEVYSLNEDEVPDQDQAATDAQAKQLVGENAEITYLDISLFKQMSGQKQEQLHQPASPLSITITIPESIRTAADGMRRTFYVLRSHAENGKTVCTPISGSYDSASGAFTFETDKFSTYVLVYKDTAISSGGHSPFGPAAAYPVTVKPAANSTLQADKTSAAKGTTVTITVTPDEGYTLESLTVLDKGGNELPLTGKAGKYTFTMPAGGVTVTASFAETGWNLGYRGCPIWPFTDAKTTDWYHDGVHFCQENGLMVGCGSNLFRPDAGTTRGMIAVMLWRLNLPPWLSMPFPPCSGPAAPAW